MQRARGGGAQPQQLHAAVQLRVRQAARALVARGARGGAQRVVLEAAQVRAHLRSGQGRAERRVHHASMLQHEMPGIPMHLHASQAAAHSRTVCMVQYGAVPPHVRACAHDEFSQLQQPSAL